jgi:DNA-binding NtrC family response regulator
LKRIMIVDDEADVTYTLQKMLEQDDHKVESFNDPRQALEYFDRTLFDLVLLDIRMPHIDGFHLFEEMRKKDLDVNIWFMTAYEVYRDQFGQIIDSKSPHFIKKPVDMLSLRQMIQAI